MTSMFAAARRPEGDGMFAAEYRVVGLSNGIQRTVALRGKITFDQGRSDQLLGTVIDITERRAAEERQALLAREVDHRAKNVLAGCNPSFA